MEADKQSILLIDDDSRNIFALSAVLKAKGFQVLSSTSAPDGIAVLKKDKGIKVVLLDMMMPEMDGYEALSVIKGDAEIRHVPVFAVTAQAMVGDRERCLKAGADEYVSKPIDMDLLMNLLKAHNVVK
jgi:two-component system, cell cycle response regulator DivK